MATIKLSNGLRSINNLDDQEYDALRRAVEFYKRQLAAKNHGLNSVDVTKCVTEEELAVISSIREDLE